MNTDFAALLAQAMEGMSQADLADKSGLRQATISRLLNRERKPSYDTIVALEKALPKLRAIRAKQAVA